jgi:hypothetical protein
MLDWRQRGATQRRKKAAAAPKSRALSGGRARRRSPGAAPLSGGHARRRSPTVVLSGGGTRLDWKSRVTEASDARAAGLRGPRRRSPTVALSGGGTRFDWKSRATRRPPPGHPLRWTIAGGPRRRSLPAAPQVSGSPAPSWTSWWPVVVAAVPCPGACPSRWLRCPVLVPDSIVKSVYVQCSCLDLKIAVYKCV